MIVKPDPRDTFLALTVRQPWASQIARGEKLAEYRSWETDYRGDILITSSARSAKGGPLGCAICVVEVYDMADDGPDLVAWLLRNPRAVPNVPTKGRLGLWEPSDLLLEQLGIEVRCDATRKALAGAGKKR